LKVVTQNDNHQLPKMKKKLFLTILLAITFRLCVNAQWQSIGPGGGIVRCFAKGGSNIFAGTDGGGVFLTTNNGGLWTAVNVGLTNTQVYSIAATPNGTTVFAGTYNGGVFISTNSGSSWTAVNTGLTNLQVEALAINGSTIFAGTNGGVFISNDNGGHWTAVNTGLGTTLDVLSLAISGTDILVGTGSGGVFLSSNNGGLWTAKNNGLTDLYVNSLAVSGTTLFAGNNSGVSVSTDNGTSWTLSTATPGLVKSIEISGTTIYAGYGTMSSGGITLSSNSGSNWATVSNGLPTTNGIFAVLISGGTVFAGTDGSGLYVSTNNGGLWTADAGITNTNAQSMSLATSGTNIFAGIFGGGVFLSTNNGSGPWTPVNTGLTTNTIQTLATMGTNVFVGTNDKGVFLSTNNGTSWAIKNNGLGTNLNITSFAIIGTTIYVGTFGGGVFKSINAGTNWTVVNTGLTNLQVQALATNGTNVYAGTYYGGVFVLTGTTWVVANTGLTNTNVNTIAVSGPRLFAGTLAGVFSSLNNGSNWIAMNTGLTNNVIISLFVDSTHVFAGTDGGGVFLSNDSASHWAAINTGLTSLSESSLAVSGSSVFVGSHGGGVWKRPLSDFVTAITSQPANITACSGNTVYFSVATTGINITYQWEESYDGGSSFHDLYNGGMYNNTITDSLQITGFESYMSTWQYRCIISSGSTPLNSNPGTLTVNDVPNLSVTDPSPVCLPNTIDITTAFTDLNSTTGTVSYWTDSLATVSLSTPTAVSTNGTYYIKKSVTPGGCSDIKPVHVSVNAVPNLSVTNPSAVCSSSTVDITSTFTDLNNSTGTVSYWLNAGATNALTTPTAVSTNGTYYIKKTAGACSDIKPVTVTINAGPNLSITNPIAVCAPATVNITTTFTDLNSISGTISYWTNAGATVSLASPSAVAANGMYYIKKTATSGGCSDIKPVVVTINTVPNVSVTNPLAVCSPGTVDITNTFTDLNSTTGTVSYWLNAGATTALTTPTAVATSGTYYIKKAASTCSDIKPVVVTINAVPNLSITNPAAICAPGTVNITTAFTDLNSTTGTITYWTDAGATVALSSPSAVIANGTYYIKKATTAGGCSDIKPITVTIHPQPTVSYIESQKTICSNAAPFTLAAGSPVGGFYSGTGVTSNTFSPSVAGVGTWTVGYTYVDNNTCSNVVTQNIEVDLCTDVQNNLVSQIIDVRIYPNPFSTSATIEIKGIAQDHKMNLVIYNLLGEEIKKIKNNVGQTITIDRADFPNGIYLYKLIDNNKTVHTGRFITE
jgi:hypothetical protein